MKNFWKWFIAGMLVAGLGVLIITSIKRENRYFNKIELSSNNTVVNRSDMSYLDTIISVGLDELQIKDVLVLAREITLIPKQEDGIKWNAHIVHGPSLDSPRNTFLLEIRKLTKQEAISTISHELIHLAQFYKGDYKARGTYIIWKGDTIQGQNIPEYQHREWEQEARGLGKILSLRLNDLLIQDENERTTSSNK